MNEVFLKTYNDIPVNRREVFRYMSCRKPDKQTGDLLDLCIDESSAELSYKVCYSVFDISIDGEVINLGFAKTKSYALSINLKDCKKAIVFAATLFSPAKSLCLQALGSERVESLCDAFNEEMKTYFEKRGYKLKPRFSPGYGDLSIELQKELLPALNSAKLLGISLGDNLMMSPSKSVTAIIGIYNE